MLRSVSCCGSEISHTAAVRKPADFAVSTAVRESSNTAHSSGGKPAAYAAARNISGRLLLPNSSQVNIPENSLDTPRRSSAACDSRLSPAVASSSVIPREWSAFRSCAAPGLSGHSLR